MSWPAAPQNRLLPNFELQCGHPLKRPHGVVHLRPAFLLTISSASMEHRRVDGWCRAGNAAPEALSGRLLLRRTFALEVVGRLYSSCV